MMSMFRPWTITRVSLFLVVIEALPMCICLTLFACGYPDGVRKTLWEEGGLQGFNSNPKLRIYFYANHREPPPIPYIWSQTSTTFNLSVAIINLWIFITRSILSCMRVLDKWTEFFLHCCMLPFWILSIVGQKSPDYTDEKHQSPTPWYLTHSCAIARVESQTACHAAQAAFGMSVALSVFYSACIWNTIAHVSFDYLMKNRIKAAPASLISSVSVLSSYGKEDAPEEGWSDDENPLMGAEVAQ